jgi:hypothetical protein
MHRAGVGFELSLAGELPHANVTEVKPALTKLITPAKPHFLMITYYDV